jgi:hypothetical protein
MMADANSFPGGYDVHDLVVAVKLSARSHVGDVPFEETERAIVESFLAALLARHPDAVRAEGADAVHARELLDERRTLLRPHLRFAWFSLAYWTYGFIAIRSGLSGDGEDMLAMHTQRINQSLMELGVWLAPGECDNELERFLPEAVSAKTAEGSTYTFLSFARFLHFAAVRRREVVTPRLAMPDVGMVYADADAGEARMIAEFLTSHDVSIVARPERGRPGTRLLVVASPDGIASDAFWRGLRAWRQRLVLPMVVALMPKSALYQDAPPGADEELWAWLGESVVVERGSGADRYVVLLSALDAASPRQWWWSRDHAMELGLSVGLGTKVRPPRRRRMTRQPLSSPAGEPYPFAVRPTLVVPCLSASERVLREGPGRRDTQYYAALDRLLELRISGEGPYALPWYVVCYRAWLAFAGQLPGFAYSTDEAAQAEMELRGSLFALGIGTAPGAVPTFFEAFARLPWPRPATSAAGVDDRAVAFVVLVNLLAQAALTRGQRVRLQHPALSCFVSYARRDESFAQGLVKTLEAKGADVWFDLNALTLGSTLDESLSGGIGDAHILFVIATPAGEASSYVRFEVETAVARGLRIVALAPNRKLPPRLRSLMAASDVVVLNSNGDADAVFETALAELRRDPEEQLRWLQSQPLYGTLREHLSKQRVGRPTA